MPLTPSTLCRILRQLSHSSLSSCSIFSYCQKLGVKQAHHVMQWSCMVCDLAVLAKCGYIISSLGANVAWKILQEHFSQFCRRLIWSKSAAQNMVHIICLTCHKMHQNCLAAGLSRTCWGSLQYSTDLLVRFRGHFVQRKWKGKCGKEQSEEKEWETE